MAKAEGKLKLIHLLYILVIGVLGIGITIGTMRNQQATNTTTIGKHEEKISANEKLLVRIDTRQEVMIKSLDEINQKLP